MIRYIVLFTLFVFTFGCKANNKNNEEPYIRQVWFPSILSDSLKYHFKQFNFNDYNTITSRLKNKYNNDLIILFYSQASITLDTPEYNNKLNMLKNDATAQITNNDINKYDFIAHYINLAVIYNAIDSVKNIIYTNKIKEIVSNFGKKPIMISFFIYEKYTEIFDITKKSGLKDNCTIYILKSGLNNILPEEFTPKNDLLPEKVKHGYITGFITQEGNNKIYLFACAW